jgi:hypothetical protein
VTFPLRVTGGYRSGKTTRLKQLSEALPEPLFISATGDCTFWSVATEIVARHDRPVRLLSTAEVVDRLGDPCVAEAVCHYQASFLGREELRTHADAAGVYDQWEDLADQADAYLADCERRGEADWAGVLVRASLLLRDPAVLEAERSRFSHILVDDFESASFAANRLLTQLADFGGQVAVAGNPANEVWRHVAGSPRYLDRFVGRFGGAADESLTTRFDAHGSGSVVLSLAPGGDAWLPWPDDSGPLPAALSCSRSWARVETVAGEPAAASPYDLDVLGGPDVPDAAARAERRRREEAARLALAQSRGPSA